MIETRERVGELYRERERGPRDRVPRNYDTGIGSPPPTTTLSGTRGGALHRAERARSRRFRTVVSHAPGHNARIWLRPHRSVTD
eukprot:1985124-Prymnesium_polylepis.1